MKTHEMQVPSKRDQQWNVAQQKRLLGQFYCQARRKQWSRLQEAVHGRLAQTDKLHRLMREERHDG